MSLSTFEYSSDAGYGPESDSDTETIADNKSNITAAKSVAVNRDAGDNVDLTSPSTHKYVHI